MNSKYRIIGGSVDAWQFLPEDEASCVVVATVFAESGIVPSFHNDELHFRTVHGHFMLMPGDWLIRCEKRVGDHTVRVLLANPGPLFQSMFEPSQHAGEKSRLELSNDIKALQRLVDAYARAMREIGLIAAQASP